MNTGARGSRYVIVFVVLWALGGGHGRDFSRGVAHAADPQEYIPQFGIFPPADVGVYWCGELVSIDAVNRRGALRLEGDGDENRYHVADAHRFSLLPYGQVRYHAAPAELRDVPLGIVLHGRFTLPPKGDTGVVPPAASNDRYTPKQNHALRLEDSVSFYERHGIIWKTVRVELGKGEIEARANKPLPHGIKSPQVFTVDPTTRVWRGSSVVKLQDIVVGQRLRFNLTWAPDWKNGQFHLAEIWLDDDALAKAAEYQRHVHQRYQRIRGLPAHIEKVEHQPGGKGIVTITLFAGLDESLLPQFQKGHWLRMAAAEPTLRTWWGDHDYKGANVLEMQRVDNPPPWSSGIRLRLEIHELLEGFRPARHVRLWHGAWPRIKLPPEERVKNFNDR